MKKCGVPFAWKSSADVGVGVDLVLVRVLRDRGLHLVGARAGARRELHEPSSLRSRWLAKSASCIAQNAGVALLGAHLERRLGRRLGARVEGQRLVLADDAQLVAVRRSRARVSVASARTQ